MSVYTGIIVKGMGLASENCRVLIAEIAKDFPAVAGCGLFGTINVRLDRPFDPRHADHWTPQIPWRPVVGLEKDRMEAFGLIKVKLDYRDQKYDAWIILPEGHAWTYM
jgi:hypothetical protein